MRVFLVAAVFGLLPTLGCRRNDTGVPQGVGAKAHSAAAAGSGQRQARSRRHQAGRRAQDAEDKQPLWGDGTTSGENEAESESKGAATFPELFVVLG